jgi:hypothetical protein
MSQPPSEADIATTIRRRPAIHRLTYGAFLQGQVWLGQSTVVVPLKPIGFEHAAKYASCYQQELLGAPAPADVHDRVSAQAADALPVLAFIRFTNEEKSPEKMEAEARRDFENAEQLVGLITGDYLQEFAFVCAASDQIYVRLVAPTSRRRLLFGPGNVGAALANNLQNIGALCASDERFAYALSTYRDALHETNKLFKIARLFNVLEALAYALKGAEVASRDAVRKLLRLENGAMAEIAYDGKRIRYDRIALAGRVREKVFHGVPFTRDDLPATFRDSFDLLTDRPDELINTLMADCELELARWGNNASVGRTAAEAKRK